MSEVKELPTKFQFGKEYEPRGSYLNLLWLTILPRIDHELSSARNDEIRYDCRDRYYWWFPRGGDVLYGCVDGEGEGGFCLGELRRGLKVGNRVKRNGHVYNLLNSSAPEGGADAPAESTTRELTSFRYPSCSTGFLETVIVLVNVALPVASKSIPFISGIRR